ncbi:coiled-coil domain-containing protein 124-like [Penaeus japonicus]|uniref:coiled-coil domain-containing protein 124-like n=1 Tax=Penaeus japonicus TaxID=27405 RepID=UPI001C712515|nr:coiled-coil domain-containing protein 124-like [Penaeus japonicus]XP_042879237.1 coiled-coil domain-containing protein 124-like [Penaeus japonicus]
MPKKFKGENTKAVVAKTRKAEKAAEEKAKKDKAIEDAYWEDDDKQAKKKMARKEDKEKKRQADLEKKAELRALVENEESSLTPKATPQKVTQFELKRNQERQAEIEQQMRAKEETKTHLDDPLVENLNRVEGDVVSASGIDAALSALSTDDNDSDRHPEKRMATAFKAFEERRLPQIKKENPSLRMSQQKQMLRKEWLKSPENPLNRK